MDGKAIGFGLDGWTQQELIRAKDDVTELLEHPGWKAVCRAVEDYGHALLRNHLTVVTDSAAKYANEVGYMKGLRELEGVAAGVIEKGKTAEHRRNAMEEAA